jgi:hypothetical protein
MRGLFIGAVLVLGVAALTAGCGGSSGGKPEGKEVAKEGSGHDWWCDEHGVKESECSMCDKEVAKACKARGDWCDKHNRALSQCFVCKPDLREKFAAEFRAKYGKEPPEPKGNVPEKQ